MYFRIKLQKIATSERHVEQYSDILFFKDERTALHETARSQAKGDFQLGEIAQCLIEAGSDVNAKSSDLGEVRKNIENCFSLPTSLFEL